MMDVMSVSAADLKENSSQQRSAGKRSRDNVYKNVDPISKRPALTCLSNHVGSITETQQRKTKVVS